MCRSILSATHHYPDIRFLPRVGDMVVVAV